MEFASVSLRQIVEVKPVFPSFLSNDISPPTYYPLFSAIRQWQQINTVFFLTLIQWNDNDNDGATTRRQKKKKKMEKESRVKLSSRHQMNGLWN